MLSCIEHEKGFLTSATCQLLQVYNHLVVACNVESQPRIFRLLGGSIYTLLYISSSGSSGSVLALSDASSTSLRILVSIFCK